MSRIKRIPDRLEHLTDYIPSLKQAQNKIKSISRRKRPLPEGGGSEGVGLTTVYPPIPTGSKNDPFPTETNSETEVIGRYFKLDGTVGRK